MYQRTHEMPQLNLQEIMAQKEEALIQVTMLVKEVLMEVEEVQAQQEIKMGLEV